MLLIITGDFHLLGTHWIRFLIEKDAEVENWSIFTALRGDDRHKQILFLIHILQIIILIYILYISTADTVVSSSTRTCILGAYRKMKENIDNDFIVGIWSHHVNIDGN